MSFDRWVIAFGDRFLSQRSFELIVEPALADLEFELSTPRPGRGSSYIAVIRAIAGACGHEMLRGSGSFLKLALLSACYYAFPIAVSIRLFETWSAFFLALAGMLALSLAPVMVCFWPARHPVRPGE